MPRPANHLNLTGRQFGLLLVMEASPPRRWHCVCACGTHVEVLTANLRQNRRICGRACPEKYSRKLTYLAEREMESESAKELATEARALLVDTMGKRIEKLGKRERSDFYDFLKHYTNIAVGA